MASSKYFFLIFALGLSGCSAAPTRVVASPENSRVAGTVTLDKLYVIIPAQNGDPSEICEERPDIQRLENCEPYEDQAIYFQENVFKLKADSSIPIEPGTISTSLSNAHHQAADGSREGATCTLLHSSSNLARKIEAGQEFSILQASPLSALYFGEEKRPMGVITTLTIRSDSTKVSYKVECIYSRKNLNGLEALLEQINSSSQRGASKISGILKM